LGALERVSNAHGFDTQVFDKVGDFLGSARLAEASCLVLDINLNGESGIDVQRQLRASGVSLPVIFMSGSDYESFREAAQEAVCVAYLRKPFPSSALIGSIEQLP
jgi:FixJ family two-component response regulator